MADQLIIRLKRDFFDGERIHKRDSSGTVFPLNYDGSIPSDAVVLSDPHNVYKDHVPRSRASRQTVPSNVAQARALESLAESQAELFEQLKLLTAAMAAGQAPTEPDDKKK